MPRLQTGPWSRRTLKPPKGTPAWQSSISPALAPVGPGGFPTILFLASRSSTYLRTVRQTPVNHSYTWWNSTIFCESKPLQTIVQMCILASAWPFLLTELLMLSRNSHACPQRSVKMTLPFLLPYLSLLLKLVESLPGARI